MKKILLFAVATLLITSAQAQTRTDAPTATTPNQRVFKANNKVDLNHNNSRATGSYWINYSDEVEFYILGGGSFPNPPVRSRSLMPIFPDTTIILGFDNGVPFGNWIHSAATMIEPNNLPVSNYDPSAWIAPGNNYSIDSMQMVYAYVRNTDPSIVDTLVLSFIEHDNSLLYTLDPTGEAWEYQDILYDTVARKVDPSVVMSEVRYPLTEADSTTYDPTNGFNLKVFSHEFSPILSNMTNKRVGVVVDFRPGYTWVPFVNGDPNADSLLGKNSFWLLSYEENGANTAPTNYGFSHNMSYVIDFRSLYAQWDDIGWNGFYLPMPFWAEGFPWEEHAIYFKATSDQVSVNEIETFSGIAVYPNPVNNNLALTLNLNKAAENLTVTVSDVLGREVMVMNQGTVAPGKNTIKVQTSDLANGVYNCTVRSGNQSANAQVVVNR